MKNKKYLQTFEEYTSHTNYEKYKNVPQEGEKVKKKKKYFISPDTQNPYDPSQVNSDATVRYPFHGI